MVRQGILIGISILLIVVWWVPVYGIESFPEKPEGQFTALLTGAEAVPPQDTPASGRVTFWFSENDSYLRYRVEVYTITDILMVHLRQGWPGRLGPPIVWLFPEGPPPTPLRYPGHFNGVLIERMITADDLIGPFRGKTIRELREEMERGRTFVQVDTVLRQIGELRGQVDPIGTGLEGRWW